MPLESALVVLVPEAEALVKHFRLQYDPSAALGVPAHVTVVYPFIPPPKLTADVLETLTGVFSKCPAFVISFQDVRRFPDVIYLSPEPAEAFQHLTEMVVKHFPETPPYGGQFADVIPHLTVAQVVDLQRLDEIATQFEPVAQGYLPIQADIRKVALMDNENGRWQVRTYFVLGSDSKVR